MPDSLYLSIWLKKKTFHNPLAAFEKLLSTFPVSRLAHAASTLQILAISFSEPPLAEHEIGAPADAETVVDLASEFYNRDSCFQLDTWWDLWSLDTDWRLAPARVALLAFAEEFDRPDGEDLRIDFGLETQFLPPPGDVSAARIMQGNITSLLRLVHDIEKALPVQRKLLWSESGENFAERLQRALREGTADPLT